MMFGNIATPLAVYTNGVLMIERKERNVNTTLLKGTMSILIHD